jgi:uncharacterized membrane protein YjgN (DUF898 family)
MNIDENQSKPTGLNELNVTFSGNAREYFGIWIVNVLLSIITLGIYSAWAKVRRKRYFYGNTWIDGHNFEYHANPKSILKGRIIVFVLFVIYNVLANINPIFTVLSLPLLFLIPWLVNKGLTFNARMTSYRNVRFNFAGRYWDAFISLILLPIVTIIPLGLLIPIATRKRLNYYYNGHSLGNTKFGANIPLKPLYKAFFIALALAILSLAIIFGGIFVTALSAGLIESLNPSSLDPQNEPLLIAGIFGSYIAMFLIFLPAYIHYSVKSFNTGIYNLNLNNEHRFTATLKTLPYTWIVLSNFIVTLLTIGLMAPWAHVRKAKYLAANFTVLASGSLDNFVDTVAQDGSVTSSEYMDMDGIDFGL